MTEVQKPIKFKKLLKYKGIDDYEIFVEINKEEHNLDFLINGIEKKITFFYEYGDGTDLECQLKKENEQLKQENEELQNEVKELQGKASSWKITASEQIAEQSILMNEIYLMQEQGAKPSEAFEKYMEKIKSDSNDWKKI